MKNILLILVLLILGETQLPAQINCNVTEDAPNFLLNAPSSVLNASGPFTVRIFVHIIRDQDCVLGMTSSEFNTAMNNLTNDFAPFNICFSLSGVEDICNDGFYNNDVFGIFTYMSSNPTQYLHSDAIDIFFCPNGPGAPGGQAHGVPIINAPPGDFIVVGGTIPANHWPGVNFPIVVNTSHLVSHEIGHCLGLYHTFHGNVCDATGGCLEHDIINNNFYNINCGDLVEDTPADPCLQNSGSTNCVTCTYTGTLNDPFSNLPYNPDTKNILSYASLNCYQTLTQGQGQRMRSFLASSPVLTPRVVPYNIFIQNKVFSQGNSLYAGTTSITVGSNVTGGIPGPVEIKNSAKVELKTQHFITLERGVTIDPVSGGYLYAHIEPGLCNIIDQINSARTAFLPYYPFLDQPKWYTVLPTFLEGTAVRKIEEIGDSIINGITYSKINVAPVNLPNLSNTYFFFNDTGNVYMREDVTSKKVYWKSLIPGGADSLVYDFNLNVGDAFPGYPNVLLANIDSVQLSGGIRKRFIFTFGGDSIIWIEGVGNPTNPLSAISWYYYPGYQVICSYQNDTLIYDEGNLYTINCGNLTTVLNENKKNNNTSFSVYPNPALKSFTILFDLSSDENIVINVLDVYGRLVKNVVNNENFIAGNHEINVTENLSPGIYLVQLKSKISNGTTKISILR